MESYKYIHQELTNESVTVTNIVPVLPGEKFYFWFHFYLIWIFKWKFSFFVFRLKGFRFLTLCVCVCVMNLTSCPCPCWGTAPGCSYPRRRNCPALRSHPDLEPHTHRQNQYHWQRCGVDGCCDRCMVSPLKNCCSASFSPSTWTGSLPPPGSMVSSRGRCRWGGRRDRGGEWAADHKIFWKKYIKKRKVRQIFVHLFVFLSLWGTCYWKRAGLSAELGFWLVEETILG